jgi:hypothetical protein
MHPLGYSSIRESGPVVVSGQLLAAHREICQVVEEHYTFLPSLPLDPDEEVV